MVRILVGDWLKDPQTVAVEHNSKPRRKKLKGALKESVENPSRAPVAQKTSEQRKESDKRQHASCLARVHGHERRTHGEGPSSAPVLSKKARNWLQKRRTVGENSEPPVAGDDNDARPAGEAGID